MAVDLFDFEALYRKYPRKEGKKRGLIRLRATIKSEAEFDAFRGAMEEYLSLCEKEQRPPQYVKHWATFVNNWTDYLTKDMAVRKTTNKVIIDSQVKRIMDGTL